MIPIRVLEVKGRKTHICCDCGRLIEKNEYKTEIVYYEQGRCWSEYSCCNKPWFYRASSIKSAIQALEGHSWEDDTNLEEDTPF